MIELLSEILEFFWDCVPRPVTVAANERASRFLCGRDFDGTRLEGWVRQDFGPGVYCLLPLVEDWGQRVVTSQHQETGIIALQDGGGNKWHINLDVEFRVDDLPAFDILQLCGNQYIASAHADAAIRVARRCFSLAEISPHRFCIEVEALVEEKMDARGVGVIQVRSKRWQQCEAFHLSGIKEDE